jgi:hypothetical protein
MHGTTNHFAGRTAGSTSVFGNSLLRADWPNASGRTAKWTETLRSHCALPLGNHSACAATRFTLTEIRHLFFGFRDIARPSERWRTLSRRKLAELDHLMDGIKAVRGVLNKLMTKCRCDTLDQCGKGIFQSMNRDVVARSLPPSRHREKYATSLRTGSGPKSSCE